ncbi:carbonate dehydratase [Globomyces pollinis-pini]|nr:carbonate dehydratase [Globomyces pollinis-pini]
MWFSCIPYLFPKTIKEKESDDKQCAHPNCDEHVLLKNILKANKKWVSVTWNLIPKFFHKLAQGQSPELLWIGCSDSRVPPAIITGKKPGDIFVHRNVGNTIYTSDNNVNAVIEYSVHHLKVKHVIVCGHYGCGAVLASMGCDTGSPTIEEWIKNIRKIYTEYEFQFESLDKPDQITMMCKLNAILNARNACLTSAVQHAWEEGQEVVVHGWIFQLSNGEIEDLEFIVSNAEEVETVTKMAIEKVLHSVEQKEV